jgi:aminoglycoside 6-adenylyltransferase
MKQDNIELLNKITDWARNENDVLFLGLIGSSSNDELLDDEYSDIDLILVTDSVKKFYNDDAWLSQIDEAWITFTESAADINYWERRCVFRNGLDVDFIIVEKEKLIDARIMFPVLSDICRKTLRVVLDKGQYAGCFARFTGGDKRIFSLPTQDEYDNLVNDFFFHYLWAYKKCLRGEYWTALQCVNGYLKNKTLTMIEWHERALHGKEYNTFYQGRYLEKWVEESTGKELVEIFSSYGKEKIIKALNANMNLFSRLAKETGMLWNLKFPERRLENLLAWMHANYYKGDEVNCHVPSYPDVRRNQMD